MKKHASFHPTNYLLLLLIAVAVLISCEKEQAPVQTFNDVFDVKGVNELNQKIKSAQTIDEISALYTGVELATPKELKKITLEELANHFENNLKLSSDEIDMLLKNDSKTYIDVINRFGSMPQGLGDMKPHFKALKSTSLNKYLLRKKADPENFYSDDYYSAVLDMQKFIKNEILGTMAAMHNLKNNAPVETIPPGNSEREPSDDAEIDHLKIIELNNIWDMWWTYWTDGTRTKHKGAAGSFPGN